LVPHRKRIEPIRYRYLRTVYQGKGLASSRRLRWGLLALALAIYVANFVGGDRGLIRRIQLRKELAAVTADNVRMRLEQDRLVQEVKLKENDPFSLEKVAREKYWMIGPGEIIYRFQDEGVVPEVPSETAKDPAAGDGHGKSVTGTADSAGGGRKSPRNP
jgi:cell division protein FtsB